MVENYTKDLKESVYHGAVVSALAVGYTMLGKTLIKMSPPSLRKFDVEDGVKLVAIIAISDFTKDHLIKQKKFLIIYKYGKHWIPNRRCFHQCPSF